MTPLRTFSVALKFAAQASPWWLVVLLPAAGLAAAALYRKELAEMKRRHAAGLLACRVLLLALVLTLAFRPSFVLRETLTYPGRIVIVADDSGSMSVPDPGADDAEGARVARNLRLVQPGALPPLHLAAERLFELEAVARRFERSVAGMEAASNAYWDSVDEASSRAAALLDAVGEQLDALRKDEAGAAMAREVEDRAQLVKEMLESIFRGAAKPDPHALEDVYVRLGRLADRCLELQAGVDRSGAADDVSRAAAAGVRAMPRADLLSRQVVRLLPALQQALPRQYLQMAPLMTNTVAMARPGDAPELVAHGGPSRILARLAGLAGEKHDFPLSAVLLLSDGQDNGARRLESVGRELARLQVPVFTGGLGLPAEPCDLAVLKVTAPPFAVKGARTTVRVLLKTALPEPRDVAVGIYRGDTPVVSSVVTLGAQGTEGVLLDLSPEQTGRFRYRVQVESVPGEVVPAANNTADFSMLVRDEPVRVLFLDWKPRWETRFALNIFQRLDYIDLNSIIGLVQPDSTVERGVRRGTWPTDAAALQLYDLVVLGTLHADLLTGEEWRALASLVRDHGRTICFLGARDYAVDTELPAPVRDLLPALRAGGRDGETPANADSEDLSAMTLTPEGALHPMTGSLRDTLAEAPVPDDGADAGRSVALLARRAGGDAILSVRLVGSGKTVFVGSDRFWSRLNERNLDAHANIFLKMVDWAVDGGLSGGAETNGEPGLVVDGHVAGAGRDLQVWAVGTNASVTIEALAGDTVVASAPAAPPRGRAELARAVFTSLPAADIRFRLKAQPGVATDPVVLLDANPELHALAQREGFLRELAATTGGEYTRADELVRSLPKIVPKARTEKRERAWRLWDTRVMLGLLFCLLTLEWVWRKLVGLV
jgi:hypothetical protein